MKTKAALEAAGDVLSGKATAAPEKPKKKNMRVREMLLRRGAEGGYIAKHAMETQDGEKMYDDHSREYPLRDMDDLQKHVSKHLPELGADKEENC